MLTTQDIKYPRTELMIRRSPVQNSLPQDVFVTVNQVQRKGRSTVVKSGIISPTELDWIRRSMQGVSQPSSQGMVSAPSDLFEF